MHDTNLLTDTIWPVIFKDRSCGHACYLELVTNDNIATLDIASPELYMAGLELVVAIAQVCVGDVSYDALCDFYEDRKSLINVIKTRLHVLSPHFNVVPGGFMQCGDIKKEEHKNKKLKKINPLPIQQLPLIGGISANAVKKNADIQNHRSNSFMLSPIMAGIVLFDYQMHAPSAGCAGRVGSRGEIPMVVFNDFDNIQELILFNLVDNSCNISSKEETDALAWETSRNIGNVNRDQNATPYQDTFITCSNAIEFDTPIEGVDSYTGSVGICYTGYFTGDKFNATSQQYVTPSTPNSIKLKDGKELLSNGRMKLQPFTVVTSLATIPTKNVTIHNKIVMDLGVESSKGMIVGGYRIENKNTVQYVIHTTPHIGNATVSNELAKENLTQLFKTVDVKLLGNIGVTINQIYTHIEVKLHNLITQCNTDVRFLESAEFKNWKIYLYDVILAEFDRQPVGDMIIFYKKRSLILNKIRKAKK